MHIAVEGFDGVGKSTAAKKLAQVTGFLLVEKPLHFLFDEEGDREYIRIRDAVNKSKNKRYGGKHSRHSQCSCIENIGSFLGYSFRLREHHFILLTRYEWN